MHSRARRYCISIAALIDRLITLHHESQSVMQEKANVKVISAPDMDLGKEKKNSPSADEREKMMRTKVSFIAVCGFALGK